MMKKTICSIVSIIAFICTTNATNITVGGNINTSTTWAKASIDTVKIIGNTTIDSLVTLTIEPGIVVDFTDNYYFNVKGRLKAIGNSSDSITFTTSDTSGFYNNTHHGWSGIRIHERFYTSDTIPLEYCIVEYGKADGSSGLPNAMDGGGLYTYSNFRMKVANTTFRNNYAAGKGGAVYDYYSFVNQNDSYYDMVNCNFINNKSDGDGGAIYTSRSIINIRKSVFKRNKSINGNGGAIKDGGTYAYVGVYNSTFSYNEAMTNGGAIHFSTGSSSVSHLIKSTFFNNNKAVSGGALSLFNIQIDLQNNVIVNNEATSSGGAIYTFNVFSTVTNTASMIGNNTIAYNKALNGGGIYIFDNTSGYDLFLNKVIFYNNETTTGGMNEDVGLGTQLNNNHPRFNACSFTADLTNTGVSVGSFSSSGSIFNTNPNFINPSAGVGVNFEGYTAKDWSLGCSSPCIDFNPTSYIPDSLDYRGTPRDINGIDIGAYEAYGYLAHPQNLEICEGDAAIFSSSYFYPNIDLNNSWIQFSMDNGMNWFADFYDDEYELTPNALMQHDSTLFIVQLDFGCGFVSSDTAMLTVRPKALTQNTVSACDSLFVGGAWQNVNGVYYDSLQTSFGCDSILETTLTINSSFYSSNTIGICQGDSALIFGNYETTAGLYYDSLTTVGTGCDSILMLNLTILNSGTGTDVQTACNSYLWTDGNTYTSNNTTAKDTIIGGSVNGCDSIVTLNLTILNSAIGTDVQTACSSFLWIDGNTYTANNTTAKDTIVGGAANGCDSIVTLNLTIFNGNVTGTDTRTECSPFVWIDGNTYTTNNTTAKDTLVAGAANGCDSIVTLNLTITTVDTSVTQTGTDLTANELVATYQWLDCDNNYAVIPGETFRTYYVLADGNYAVEVTYYGCVDTSSCYNVIVSGINENTTANNITIYPNPVKDQLCITAENEIINSVNIISVTGKTVKTITQNTTTINVADLTKGFYLLQIQTDKGIATKQFIKE